MRVLGIDPGSRITGFGIIEIDNGKLHYVTSGCIKMQDKDLPARLKTIFEGVSEVIDNASPEFMAIEKVFVSNNARSALILGQARGAAISAGVNRGSATARRTRHRFSTWFGPYSHLMVYRRKMLRMLSPVLSAIVIPWSTINV